MAAAHICHFHHWRRRWLCAFAGAVLADPLVELLCYVGLTQLVKMWLIRKAWYDELFRNAAPHP